MNQTENLKPLSAADIISDNFTLPDFNFDIKIPEEINYQNLIRKLENKAKHLEIQIEQNRKRGIAICQECFNAMRATEVLGFDFLFTEYLIGTAERKQVCTFVDSCIRPSFNMISGDPRHIDDAADHIRTVQTQIQKSVDRILGYDPKGVEISKRAPEFLQFLQERKQSLDNDLQSYEEEIKNQKSQQNTTVIPVVFNDTSRSTKNDTDTDFEKWVLNELKPGVVLVDSQIAETRALFGSCIHRIQAIQELKDQIAQLKSTSSSTQNLRYIDCDPETIYNSPFFVAVQENCGFLGTALSAIHSHQQIIPDCKLSIDSCEAHLKELKEKCQATIGQMENITSDKENNIKATKEKIDTLTQKLKPYGEYLQFKVSDLENLQNETDEFDKSIDGYLKSLLDKTENENMRSKIEILLGILNELRETRENIKKLCQDSFSSINANIETQNELLKAIINYSKAVESVSQYEKEVQQLEEYEKCLRKIVEFMHADEVKNWCTELTKVSDHLFESIKKQEEIYKDFEQLIKIGEKGIEEIKAKEKDVENLIEENKKLVEQEALLHVEALDAEEELFSLMQQIEALGGWNNSEMEERLADCATCPICKERQRNEIIISCGHPLCSECIATAKKDHICPICSANFNDDDIKPFFLQ